MRHRLNRTERNGTALRAPNRLPPQFRTLDPALLNPTRRRVSLTALAFVLASTLFQQSPAQPYYSHTGNWEYLTASADYRVRWRNDILSNPYQDPKSSYNGGDRIDIYDTYGIHAAVLPTKVYFPNLDPVGVRGTVMLWGNGTGYTFPEPPINDPRTYNYSYSSFLLWNPLLHGNGSADRLLFGFVGYTKDPDTTSNSVLSIDLANVFCSGHSFMPDGKLFVSGGSQYYKANATAPTQILGAKTCYLFDSAQWRNADGQPAHNGWSLPLGQYNPLDPLERIGMGVDRWYPSTLLLPDKKMLIAGGTTRAEANRQCTHPDGLNTTYQIYDPDANAFSTYNLNVVGGCDGHAAWYNFDEADQRFTLGNEYPRLHGATWATGSPPNQTLRYRSVYAGPDSRVYLFDPAAPSSGWALRSVAPGSAFDVRRYAGSTVLLPRMEPDALNPQTAGAQALSRIAQIGGRDRTDICDANSWGKFIGIVGLSGVDADVARALGPWAPAQPVNHPPERPGKYHSSATVLPTGSVLITGGLRKNQLGCAWNFAEHSSFGTWLYSAGGDWSDPNAKIEVLQPAPSDDGDAQHAACTEELQKRLQSQYGVPDGVRGYHSTAVLLPDASVLTAGTDMKQQGYGPPIVCGFYVSRAPTIFYPPYFYLPGTNQKRSAQDRPRIVAIPREETWTYGEEMRIDYLMQDQQDPIPIKSVVLVRPSSVTHSVNFDQMLVRLKFDLDHQDPESALYATMPFAPQIAPPGWYMLFLVDAHDVPSVASWVRLDYSGELIFEGELEEMGEGDSELSETRWPLVDFEVRDLATDEPISNCSIPMNGLDDRGRFSTTIYSNLAPGNYRLRVAPYLNWLGKSMTVSVGQDRRLSIGGLTNGDSTGDNLVDTEDLFQIADAAGQYAQGDRRDLNKDGWIDAADLAIALWNLGRQGD